MECIDLAQDRDKKRPLMYSVVNFRHPLGSGNFLSSPGTGRFSRAPLVQGVSQFIVKG
jgi:hypothetical protein